MSGTRARALLALMTLMPVGPAAIADNGKPADPATDAELLEFLGSVDSGAEAQGADDGSWIEYLSQIDIGKLASTGDPQRARGARQVAAGTQPATSGARKDE